MKVSDMKPLFGAMGLLCLLAGVPAHAAIADPLIRGAKYCTSQLSAQERRYGIPASVLAAISNTESGRWNDTLGMVLPWPWTINAEGKGYYFKNKSEAVRKVKALQAQGMKSIDIGCMQINLKHHPKAFRSVEEAFEPRHNVAYAAKFLRSNYDEFGQWDKAVAAYHSRTPKYGNKYLARVKKSYNAITGKVNTALNALAEAEPKKRSNSPSYRLVKVYDQGEKKFARLRSSKSVIPLGTNRRFSLSVDDAKGALQPSANTTLRAVDRLNTSAVRSAPVGRAAKRQSNAVRQQQHSAITIRLPDTQNERRQAASAASASALGRDGFVSHFNDTSAKTPAEGTKAKFIFVQ